MKLNGISVEILREELPALQAECKQRWDALQGAEAANKPCMEVAELRRLWARMHKIVDGCETLLKEVE